MDLCEFKANLVYRVSSRTAWAITQRNLVSKKYHPNPQKNYDFSNSNVCHRDLVILIMDVLHSDDTYYICLRFRNLDRNKMSLFHVFRVNTHFCFVYSCKGIIMELLTGYGLKHIQNDDYLNQYKCVACIHVCMCVKERDSETVFLVLVQI